MDAMAQPSPSLHPEDDGQLAVSLVGAPTASGGATA